MLKITISKNEAIECVREYYKATGAEIEIVDDPAPPPVSETVKSLREVFLIYPRCTIDQKFPAIKELRARFPGLTLATAKWIVEHPCQATERVLEGAELNADTHWN